MKHIIHLLLLFSLTAVAQERTITFISPSKDTVIRARVPVTITLQATAFDTTGIRNIKFYDGTKLLFTENASPYVQSWTFTDSGLHALKVIATTGDGKTKQTSLKLTITEPDPPRQDTSTVTTNLPSNALQLRTLINEALSSLRAIDLFRHEVPVGAVNGINRTYIIPGKVVPGSEVVIVGYGGGLTGGRLPAKAYTATYKANELVIVLNFPLPDGSWIEVEILK